MLALLLVVSSLAAACGDDAATTTATVTTSTTTSTTTTTTTTAPADVHPAWGASWEDLWPDSDAAATYRLGGFGLPADLPVRFETGVEWRGATSDRIIAGSTLPGQMGAALYLDRPEPWVLRLTGVEAVAGAELQVEYFDEPLVLDLRGLPAEPPSAEVGLVIKTGEEPASEPHLITYRLEWVGIEALDVAAGRFPDALHMQVVMTGEYLFPDGEGSLVFDMWLHPEQLILKWEMGASLPLAGTGGTVGLRAAPSPNEEGT